MRAGGSLRGRSALGILAPLHGHSAQARFDQGSKRGPEKPAPKDRILEIESCGLSAGSWGPIRDPVREGRMALQASDEGLRAPPPLHQLCLWRGERQAWEGPHRITQKVTAIESRTPGQGGLLQSRAPARIGLVGQGRSLQGAQGVALVAEGQQGCGEGPASADVASLQPQPPPLRARPETFTTRERCVGTFGAGPAPAHLKGRHGRGRQWCLPQGPVQACLPQGRRAILEHGRLG